MRDLDHATSVQSQTLNLGRMAQDDVDDGEEIDDEEKNGDDLVGKEFETESNDQSGRITQDESHAASGVSGEADTQAETEDAEPSAPGSRTLDHYQTRHLRASTMNRGLTAISGSSSCARDNDDDDDDDEFEDGDDDEDEDDSYDMIVSHRRSGRSGPRFSYQNQLEYEESEEVDRRERRGPPGPGRISPPSDVEEDDDTDDIFPIHRSASRNNLAISDTEDDDEEDDDVDIITRSRSQLSRRAVISDTEDEDNQNTDLPAVSGQQTVESSVSENEEVGDDLKISGSRPVFKLPYDRTTDPYE